MSEDITHPHPADGPSSSVEEILEAARSDGPLWERPRPGMPEESLRHLSRRELVELVRGLRGIVDQQENKFACITEIGSALGTTFNLDELLIVIMDKITQLMEAERSTLFLLSEDGTELWSKVSQGVLNTEIRLNVGEGIAGWVAMTGKSMNIHDAYGDPRFNPAIDARTGYQTRSILCQPMRNQEGSIIGVVQVLNRVNGYFTAEDESLLSAIASQAAIAIENSKLYLSVLEKNTELTELTAKLEERVAELDLLIEIERELGRHIDLEGLVDSLTRKTGEVFHARAAALTLREPDHHRTFFQVRGDADDWQFFTRTLSVDEGISAHVIQRGEPFLSNVDPSCETVPGASAAELGMPIRSVIAAPLFDDEERCLGALEVFNHANTERGFTEEELKVLTLIASRIAGAVVARRRHAELEKANRLASIGQMLSGVIHDLKNPIAIISGYVQLMARSDDREQRDDYADSIRRQFQQLNQMTQELLNFARGDKNILPRKVFLNNFFEDVEELLEEELGPRKVDLQLELAYRGEVKIDAAKMKRAILNLARNAADSMPAGGTFTIHVKRDGDDVVYAFEDTGHGVPLEIRERLFDSFVTKGKKHGTGLGLAIVKKIVDEHQGTITFESTLNEGTTFYIRIPREL